MMKLPAATLAAFLELAGEGSFAIYGRAIKFVTPTGKLMFRWNTESESQAIEMVGLFRKSPSHFYEAMLKRVGELMNAAAGTPEARELEDLAHLVCAYEKKLFPIAPPTAAEASQFRKEQMGLA